MDLKVGETQDLIVWAFPKAIETTQDTLLGRIASNPAPVEFPISCVGAKPQIEVRLDLPLPSATVPADAAAVAESPAPEAPKAADAKPAAVAKPGAAKGKAPPPPELPLTPRSKVPPLAHALWGSSTAKSDDHPANCLLQSPHIFITLLPHTVQELGFSRSHQVTQQCMMLHEHAQCSSVSAFSVLEPGADTCS